MERKFKLQPKQQRKRPQFISPMREPTRKTAETHNISFSLWLNFSLFFSYSNPACGVISSTQYFSFRIFFQLCCCLRWASNLSFVEKFEHFFDFWHSPSLAITCDLAWLWKPHQQCITQQPTHHEIMCERVKWDEKNYELDIGLLSWSFFFKRWKLLSETAFSERLLNFICDNACTIVSCLSLCATKLRFGESLALSPPHGIYIVSEGLRYIMNTSRTSHNVDSEVEQLRVYMRERKDKRRKLTIERLFSVFCPSRNRIK